MRIASAAALVVLVAAGCGSSSGPRAVERALPRTLARAWAARAAAIAATAESGDGCRARRLAGSLRTDVISAGGRVPARLRVPLLEAVDSLADRVACLAPPVTVTTTAQPAPKPKPPKGHRSHGPHDHHGKGGDQGSRQ